MIVFYMFYDSRITNIKTFIIATHDHLKYIIMFYFYGTER